MFWIILITITALILATAYHVRIVPQSNAYVIERLGTYYATWNAGIHFLVPFIDRIASKVTLKEIVLDFPPGPTITKDNVTMQVDTVVYCFITDPKLYTYGVDNPVSALGNLTQTTLRNIIGELELDETLTSRDIINTKMRSIVDEATDPWGIKVNRCEIKNLMLNQDLQDSMEKQMRAERERREKILQAEGEKKAAILIAEGEKEATVLSAQAEKEATIAKAEAEAESLRKIAEAKAEAIRVINEAKPTKEYLQLESYNTMARVAEGQATKLIIPSDLQNIVTNTSTFKEALEDQCR